MSAISSAETAEKKVGGGGSHQRSDSIPQIPESGHGLDHFGGRGSSGYTTS